MRRRYEPMLAEAAEEAFLVQVESDPLYAVGRKRRGFRVFYYIESFYNSLIARSGTDFSDCVPYYRDANLPLSGTVLDCEAHSLSDRQNEIKSLLAQTPSVALANQHALGKVQLLVFDVLCLGGNDVTGLVFAQRREILERVFVKLERTRLPFHLESLHFHHKHEYFRSILEAGGEGVIVKRLDSVYAEGSRGWFKIKREHTWDVIIMGFTPGTGKYMGTVGAIIFGAYHDGGLVEIGKTSGMTDLLRDEFAARPDEFIGQVIEVKGQEVGSRGGIIHPRFKDFRLDKKPEDCLLKDIV